MTIRSGFGVGRGSSLLPWRTLVLAVGALSAYLLLGAAPADWVFDREAIAAGEWWRLLTGHWVHSDARHAAWDIGALLLFGVLFEPRLGWRLPLVLLLASLGVDAWLWWGDPVLRHYCGLSAILNGLLVCGLAQFWRESHHPLIVLTAVGAALKILVEINAGHSLVTPTAWPSVPGTHAAGFVCGLLLVAGGSLRQAKSLSPPAFAGTIDGSR